MPDPSGQDLITRHAAPPPAALASVAEEAHRLALEAVAANTKRAYRAAWADLRLVAIRRAHRLAGHALNRDHPAIRDVFAGIKRTMGTAQDRKAPLLADTLRRIVTALPDTIKGVRDRALLLLGFAAALRRSELVALDIEPLEFGPDGLVVILTRRKTDQERRGRWRT